MSKPSVGNEAEWQAAHAALVGVRTERAGLDFREGQCLLAARRAGAHHEMGYGSFTEYVERVLGYAPRVTFDKLRVAGALESLPELSRELRDGGLSEEPILNPSRRPAADPLRIPSLLRLGVLQYASLSRLGLLAPLCWARSGL